MPPIKTKLYPALMIKPGRAKNIVAGHPWIFSNAIERKDPALQSGGLCEVYQGKDFLGIGYYNELTDIAVRMLTTTHEPINTDFFHRRFAELKRIKTTWITSTNAYRLVFGESDGLPGLIIDQYADTLVIQFHSLGISMLKEQIVAAIEQVFSPRNIYLKDSLFSKTREGINQHYSETVLGNCEPDVLIEEHGLQFAVNVVQGQKTGFFLDQRENRRSILPYVKQKRVLNCFAYTGGFSVYAATQGAQVTSVDISPAAIEYARKNFRLNHFDPAAHSFVVADVFEYLKTMPTAAFEVIILDPPSFAHKRTQVKQAIKAYLTINSKALEKLPSGGILITSSCTTHIDELTFIKILHQSAVNTHCQLKVLHAAVQPFDHAYNLHFPEGRYLKFFILLKS